VPHLVSASPNMQRLIEKFGEMTGRLSVCQGEVGSIARKITRFSNCHFLSSRKLVWSPELPRRETVPAARVAAVHRKGCDLASPQGSGFWGGCAQRTAE
jgi:hypothetical protein